MTDRLAAALFAELGVIYLLFSHSRPVHSNALQLIIRDPSMTTMSILFESHSNKYIHQTIMV